MTTQEQQTPINMTNNTEHLAELATLVKAVQDALTDDMVTRLSSVFSEGVALFDRLTRNEGLMHLLRELDRPENQRFLVSLSDAISATSKDMQTMSDSKGGAFQAYKLICEPGTQEGLLLLSLLGKYLGQSIRK